jgi:hypothetical protein
MTMKVRQLLVLPVTFFLLASCKSSSVKERPSDVADFRGVKWGSSLKETKSRLEGDGEIQVIDDESIKAKFKDEALHDETLYDTEYDLTFVEDVLAGVSIQSESKKPLTKADAIRAFIKTKEFLESKYFKPDRLNNYKAEWFFSSCTITMFYYYDEKTSKVSINTTYQTPFYAPYQRKTIERLYEQLIESSDSDSSQFSRRNQ